MENMEKGKKDNMALGRIRRKRKPIITEVHEDHAIMEADGMHLWIDDDTAEMFS